MQHRLLVSLLVFLSAQAAAQTRRFIELKPKRAYVVSPAIFADGSFQVEAGGKLYAYDAEGNLRGEPVAYCDSVANRPNLSVTDKKLDIRYTLEPVLSGVGKTQKRQSPNTIRVEKLDGKGVFYQDIRFLVNESDLPPQKAKETGYAWQMTNGDPAFVRFYTWHEDGAWYARALQYVLHLSDNRVEVTRLMERAAPRSKPSNSVVWGNVLGVVGGKLVFSVTRIDDYRLLVQETHRAITDFWTVDDSGTEIKVRTASMELPKETGWHTTAPVQTNIQANGNVLLFQEVYLEKIGSDDNGLPFFALHAEITEFDEQLKASTCRLDVSPDDMLLYNPSEYQLLSCWQSGGARAFFLPQRIYGNDGPTDISIFRPAAGGGYTMTFVPNVPVTGTRMEYAAAIFQPETGLGPLLLEEVIGIGEAHDRCAGCKRKCYAAVRIEDGVAYVLVAELLVKGSSRVRLLRIRYDTVPVGT